MDASTRTPPTRHGPRGIGTQVGRSRLWKLHFTDLSNPAAGGTIEAVLDGTEGQNMLDNITIDTQGRVLMDEDVGNAAHNGKVWMYDIATDSLVQVGQHDPARFGGVGVPATAPFTQDEESSGVIDVSSIFGAGTYMLDVQAHYPNGSTLVEGGQLMLMKIATPTIDSVVVNDGSAQRSRVTSLTVTFSTQVTFGAGAFALTNGDGTAVQLLVDTAVVGGKTVATITFSGSLADGTYTPSINGNAITDAPGQKVDADADGLLGGERTETFITLFGDLNGDGQVNGAEVSASAHAIGATAGDADYLWYLDFNGAGTIDGKAQREIARRPVTA